MADNVVIEFCVLNVAASPHEKGVYASLLRNAAGHPINYRGSDYTALTEPRRADDGFYQGRIVCWTEIDKSQPAIDKAKLAEADLEDFNLNLPDNLGFNGRIFLYTFRESDHKMFIETKNEFGKRLSPRIAGRIAERLFGPDVQGPDAPLVEVTVVPDEDALRRILAIPDLRRLKIHLLRPNPDDIADDAEEVLSELVQQGARSQDITLISTAGLGGVKPNERAEKQAKVAELNGFVEGSGKGDIGETIRGSTREHPKIIQWFAGESRAFVSGALRIARETTIRIRGGEDV